MVRGATGLLLACALWSGALVLGGLEPAGVAPDDAGSYDDDGAADLPTVHDEARADVRRVEVEEEPDRGDPDDVVEDELDLRWWADDLDDDPDPEPPPLDDDDEDGPAFVDDLDEWLGPADDAW